MTPLCCFKLILSRKLILIPSVIEASTCVMTHALCLISEISCNGVSVLVSCILLRSSEARADQHSGAHFWFSTVSKTIEQQGLSQGGGRRERHAERWHECCIFSGLFADDGAEEAEAADWPAGAPAAHERQPAAAGVETQPTWSARPPLRAYLITVRKHCNIVSHKAMCSSGPRSCCSLQ